MPIKSLSASSLVNFQKYSSMLAGNDPYFPFTSDYDLLTTQVISGTQSSVTFSNVDTTYGGIYQHLQLRVSARTSPSEHCTQLKLTLNGTDLAGRNFLSTGGSVLGEYYTTEKIMLWVAGSASSSDDFAGGFIDILDPFETGKNTTVRAMSGMIGSTIRFGMASGALFSTSAISTIALSDRQGGNFLNGSQVSLYGLKGA